MFYSIANSLVNKLTYEHIVEDRLREVYVYGIELILSSIINILVLVAISLIASEPLAWLLFLIPFIPQRMTAGGYHASSHFKCIATSAIAFLLLLSLIKLIPSNHKNILSIVIACGNLAVVLLLSPVQSKNKPLTDSEIHKNRILSIIISLVHVLCVILLLFVNQTIPKLGMFYIFGVFAAGVSLVVGNTNICVSV